MVEELDFDRDGAFVLRGAFDPSGLAEQLWAGLASRHRILEDDRSTWPDGTFGKLTRFGRSGRFASVGTSSVAAGITDVLGPSWHEDSPWGQPLITFPMPVRWEVPHGWHIDFPPVTLLPAVRMFAYLSRVRAGGGGTVIVAGSHRLAERLPGIKSAALRAELARRSTWFRDLWRPTSDDDRVHRYMVEGAEVDGLHVRVVELTGDPGDVVLWHPALFHAVAPNCRDEPRFMLTHTAFRNGRTGAN